MSILNRADIFSAKDVTTETVSVPEWGHGASVLVRGMTGRERDGWESENVRVDEQGKVHLTRENSRARLCARCIVDEAGARLFNEADTSALGEKCAAALDRIFDVAARLSGISRSARGQAEKNSPTDPTA